MAAMSSEYVSYRGKEKNVTNRWEEKLRITSKIVQELPGLNPYITPELQSVEAVK